MADKDMKLCDTHRYWYNEKEECCKHCYKDQKDSEEMRKDAQQQEREYRVNGWMS